MRLVHPLPPAPEFLGRGRELRELGSFWESGASGVLALVGLGGAGKTALAAHFLASLQNARESTLYGLFEWSFYQEPDAGLFLRELFDYLAPGAAPVAAKGGGLLHMLADALRDGGRNLIVLDGLERVQRQGGPAGGYGQIEDPLLKDLLLRIAQGLSQTSALVTSRFPLTDLAPLTGRGYRHLDVGELEPAAARDLLRRRGVRGGDEVLDALVESYGGHPLTLDHLGGLIGHFLDGDAGRAPEAPAFSAPGSDRQALRLARLLSAYELHLPPPELALLSRLCALRRSAREEQLLDLFLCSPLITARVARELTEAIARLPHAGKHDDDFIESMANDVRMAIEAAQCAAPLAGPEAAFRREILEAAAQLLESQEEGLHVDLDDIAHLYTQAPDDSPSEQFPLGTADRAELRIQYRQFNRLRDHPLLPFKEPDPVLSKAFDKLGWGKPLRGLPEDLGPADVLNQFLRARNALRRIVFKHIALRRVREVCRLRQEKWAVAGALAALSAGELRQLIDSLVGRHLVLREADASLSAHPAVRDHFARAGGADRGRWHALLGQQLVSLVQRPGLRLPEDRASLDLVEEAIYHAAAAGASAEAVALYQEVLGGLRHLGWRLGEIARGLRILRGFNPCPDRWALGWFLRALGELEEACQHNDLPYFRADVRLLQGRLPEVEREGDPARSAMAAFLMGRTTTVPPPALGCAVPRAQAWLYLGQLGKVEQAANLAPLYHDLGWEGERARCVLLAAEAARRCVNVSECRQRLEHASSWVLHSGSAEHLCLFHGVRARLALDAGELETARRAVDEGLYLARRFGFGLYHVDLLCARGQILLASGVAAAAEQAGEEALARATAADCRFAWGEGEAWHLVDRALFRQGRNRSASAAGKKARALWRQIGDPRA